LRRKIGTRSQKLEGVGEVVEVIPLLRVIDTWLGLVVRDVVLGEEDTEDYRSWYEKGLA
jgi:hypothetical protein